jgi:GNAT superfamily N-acetyltransferase
MTQLQSGNSLIQQYPHVLFEQLAEDGYVIQYCMGEGFFRPLDVVVFHGEQVVATADFSDDGPAAHCQNVRVDEHHRRRGIANTIYVFAEVAYGKRLWDFWKDMTDSQSVAGRKLWAQPNRPFGHLGMIAGRPAT